MSSLRRRIAVAEARMKIVGPSILSIVIINDPGGLGEDDGQSAPSKIRYRRDPQESVGTFRYRACEEAERAGEKLILFGGRNIRGRPASETSACAVPGGTLGDDDSSLGTAR
jgi:hypothetical protein